MCFDQHQRHKRHKASKNRRILKNGIFSIIGANRAPVAKNLSFRTSTVHPTNTWAWLSNVKFIASLFRAVTSCFDEFQKKTFALLDQVGNQCDIHIIYNKRIYAEIGKEHKTWGYCCQSWPAYICQQNIWFDRNIVGKSWQSVWKKKLVLYAPILQTQCLKGAIYRLWLGFTVILYPFEIHLRFGVIPLHCGLFKSIFTLFHILIDNFDVEIYNLW